MKYWSGCEDARQPGQAEEKLGDEEPGPVAPSDAALQRLYIA